MNYFEDLNAIDVSRWIEKKNGLAYVSWANAWGELKKKFPTANYKVYEREDGVNYFTDGKTCWVKVGVIVPCISMYEAHKDAITLEPLEHIEYLPVMDYKNKSIPLDQVTSFDVNKAIQRALTKAIARHGLGLYIYAGEDLPEAPTPICADCGSEITAFGNFTAAAFANGSMKKYGRPLCKKCCDKQKEVK